MTLSTGRGLRWLIWQAEPGRRTEASQIIHKHNGHQYWTDDRWADLQRPGFNFYSLFHFFSILQETVLLSQSHLSALKPVRRKLKKGAKGGSFSEANDKMNQARCNNGCDMNNDAIMMLGGHCHGNKTLSVQQASLCPSQMFLLFCSWKLLKLYVSVSFRDKWV